MHQESILVTPCRGRYPSGCQRGPKHTSGQEMPVRVEGRSITAARCVGPISPPKASGCGKVCHQVTTPEHPGAAKIECSRRLSRDRKVAALVNAHPQSRVATTAVGFGPEVIAAWTIARHEETSIARCAEGAAPEVYRASECPGYKNDGRAGVCRDPIAGGAPQDLGPLVTPVNTGVLRYKYSTCAA